MSLIQWFTSQIQHMFSRQIETDMPCQWNELQLHFFPRLLTMKWNYIVGESQIFGISWNLSKYLKFLYFGDFCSSIPSKVTCQKWVKVIMQCFLYFFRVLSIENVTKLSTETESHFGRVNFKNHSYKWNSMEVYRVHLLEIFSDLI